MSQIFEIVQAMSGQKNSITIPVPYLDFFAGDQQAHALGAILNQLVFWSGKSDLKNGWFYKEHAELASEIRGVSPDQIHRLVKKICQRWLPGVVETKQAQVNGTKKTHYRVDGEALIARLFPPAMGSAESQNGNREVAEPVPQNHGTENAESQNPSRDVAEPILYTDHYTDPDLQIIKPVGQSPKATDLQQTDPLKIDYDLVLETFHTTLPELPNVLKMTDGRRKVLRNLWKTYDLTTEKWGAYLRYIAKNCRWMLEDRPDTTSGKTWRKKDFDYLITEKCYLSVKEHRANDLPKVARLDTTERDAAFVRLVAQGKKPVGRVQELAKAAACKSGLGRMNEVMARASWKSIWAQAVTQASEEDLARIAS